MNLLCKEQRMNVLMMLKKKLTLRITLKINFNLINIHKLKDTTMKTTTTTTIDGKRLYQTTCYIIIKKAINTIFILFIKWTFIILN